MNIIMVDFRFMTANIQGHKLNNIFCMHAVSIDFIFKLDEELYEFYVFPSGI